MLLLFSCCVRLCDPMNYSTPGFPVPHHLLEFAQVHAHWVGDAIQPSHPLPPYSFAFNLSQHEGLFEWVSSSHQGAKVLQLQASDLPMNIEGWFPLRLTASISLLSKGLSRVLSSTTIWKHQFVSAQPYGSAVTSVHDYWKNHSIDYIVLNGPEFEQTPGDIVKDREACSPWGHKESDMTEWLNNNN